MAKSKTKKTLAAIADKYDLYQRSVQEPEAEIPIFKRAYRDAYGKTAVPRLLREDFCGTFAICCTWVKAGRNHQAIGVDLDPEPLDWGKAHNLAALTPAQRERVTLMRDDVRKVKGPKADILSAQNFSFWLFKTRAEVRDYFKAARANLANRGIMVIDMMGGPDLLEQDQTDLRKIKAKDSNVGNFEYQWEQARYDPITHDVLFHIHFKFKDSSTLQRAFTYDWRLWSLPETCELLKEAGFRQTHIYWEGTDADGEGNGQYRRRVTTDPEPCWISYIVAVK